MLHEYAIEPASLAEWKDFRYLIEGCGIAHGRLISQFPKEWPKKVYDACSAFSFLQKQQLQIELERVKKHALIRSGRAYDGALSWIENAMNQQQNGKPFRAVIVKDAAGRPEYVAGIDDLTVNNPLWKTKREDKIHRTPVALGEAICHLLGMSNRILFVDKLYHPAALRWQETLLHFIALASDGRIPPSFEYHCEIDSDSLGKPEAQRNQEYQSLCDKFLKPKLPSNTKIQINRWTKWHNDSDFFHARYILTEKGGVRIDWGLDSGKSGQKTDVTLLGEEMWRQNWELFTCKTKFKEDDNGNEVKHDFQWVDDVTVCG